MKQQKMRFRMAKLILIVLLLVAAFYGVYSVQVYGNRWISSDKNYRYRSAKSSVIPGDITDRNQIVLATTDSEGNRVYQQDLLSRASLVHLIGDSQGNISNGIESFQANSLLGMNASLSDRLSSIFSGKTLHGDNIQLTIDSELSTYIVKVWRESDIKEHCGAVIAMNYQTGEILSMVSLPVYDPDNIPEEAYTSSAKPFWNRVTQATLPPGSVFKIITAAAACSELKDADSLTFHCDGALAFGNATLTDYGNEVHGDITLSKAFRVSCNNTFAQIALKIGDAALRKTAENFGFNDNFLFRDLVLENSTYPTKNRSKYEIAWSGVGQSQIVATPMHMCMIAASIANDGVMMEPRLIKSVTSPGGTVRESFSAKEYRTVCSVSIAKKLQQMMEDVVTSGTGTRAQVNGLTVAGKTGSAESTDNGEYVTHSWFVGYAAEKDLPVAVCVMVENGGSGGKAAAPIAQKVIAYLDDKY